MLKVYKIKCKICGDILQTKVPIKNEIKCSCGNISIYSDYIGYGYINHLSAQECYEDLSEPISREKLEKYFQEIDK